ncbi:phosphoglycerate mutase family protein, partial [Ostertagia ostertagi]
MSDGGVLTSPEVLYTNAVTPTSSDDTSTKRMMSDGGVLTSPEVLYTNAVTPTSSDDTSTKRMVAHSSEHGFSGSPASDQVRIPNVIVMVGLPARGKTYISKKLCRYLNWIGIKTRVFNVGEYRRTEANAADAVHGANASFFSPNNAAALKVRNESARRAMNDMADCLKSGACNVAIFDATNTTRERRKTINEFCQKNWLRCFFIESVCDDERIIDSNITDVKVNSPDYKGLMSAEQAKEDFLKRIENYKQQFINAGRSFFVHNVQGHVQSRVVYFLMNIHLLPRSIFLTRHGQSEYNAMGRLGGDSPLTAEGEKYAEALGRFFEKAQISDLRIWCSQKVRAAQTAQKLKSAFHTEYWKALDEIDAGICEGLTYDDIQQ